MIELTGINEIDDTFLNVSFKVDDVDYQVIVMKNTDEVEYIKELVSNWNKEERIAYATNIHSMSEVQD